MVKEHSHLQPFNRNLSADGCGCAPALLVVWHEATQPKVYKLYGRAKGNL